MKFKWDRAQRLVWGVNRGWNSSEGGGGPCVLGDTRAPRGEPPPPLSAPLHLSGGTLHWSVSDRLVCPPLITVWNTHNFSFSYFCAYLACVPTKKYLMSMANTWCYNCWINYIYNFSLKVFVHVGHIFVCVQTCYMCVKTSWLWMSYPLFLKH